MTTPYVRDRIAMARLATMKDRIERQRKAREGDTTESYLTLSGARVYVRHADPNELVDHLEGPAPRAVN